jgi:signal transduction histidine kinase
MKDSLTLFSTDDSKLPRFMRRVLIEQLKWLIKLRWLAVIGIVATGLICTSYNFAVLLSAVPIYTCAGILFLCNIGYLLVLSNQQTEPRSSDKALGLIQVEVDLVILTVLIHFSGGIMNPFVLFYVFHIIIATIILPKTMSFCVGISAIIMYGLMAVGEMNGWVWLNHHPLMLSSAGTFWQDPVYVLGAFISFVAMTVLTQHLTRTIIARMTAKELEAARNQDVLSAIIKAVGEGLVFITNTGKVAICNPAAQHWLGNPDAKDDDGNAIPSRRASKPDGSLENWRLEDFPRALEKHIKNLIVATTDEADTIKFNLSDMPERYIDAKCCPVVDIDGDRLGYVIVGQDLTTHKKLEHDLMERTEETAEINEMLKLSRIEMAQREKMVAIGQMATGIAHEIGNPLASLSSVVQYLQRKISDDEQKEQLNVISQQVERISIILKRMLSLSRPATSEYKWTDINGIVEGTLTLIKFDKRARSVDIVSKLDNKLPMVWLNPLHIEQIFLNITINALDAIKAKGSDEEHRLEIASEFTDGMIEIRITDSGIGMEQEVCRKAFESFFTTKEIGKGTGLGLYISYNLVTEVDGTINLDSEVGKGTTVTIRLPVRPKNDLFNSEEENVT